MKRIVTTLFKNFIGLPILKRAPLIIENYFESRIICTVSSCHIAQRQRFYQTKRAVKLDSAESGEWLEIKSAEHQAQAAFMEYLHSTRSLPFLDAENMSQNSPCFLMKLMKRVGEKEEGDAVGIGSSLTRFLRYHPINEFEPFFESIGLDHSEYCDFLPRDLMFLSDDSVLLENYQVLCDYGVPRNRLGRIYKEATEVFQYDSGALQSKLIDYENFGLSKYSLIKIVSASPNILTRNGKKEFIEFCEVLKRLGIEFDWIGEHVKKDSSCLWNRMLEMLSLLSKMGCSDEDQVHIICQHPDILFKDSGHVAFLVIGFVSKFGATTQEMRSLLVNFPNIPVEEFIQNMWNSYRFLVELKMDVKEIGPIVCLFPDVLGSCRLRKFKSLRNKLYIGRKQLSKLIENDPLVLKNWVLGVRVHRLSIAGNSQMLKAQFLSGIGFVKDSSEMKKALKKCRADGSELQKRFDFLVQAGLSAENVTKMVKMRLSILNQSKEVLNKKIDHIVNGLGYPVSCLAKCPSVLTYSIRRFHCRISMCDWLKDQGSVPSNLALSTFLPVNETTFKQRYVYKHPGGPEHWEKLEKDISST